MDAATLVAELGARGLTLAVAESLTGGLLVAEFVAVPGVSSVLNGGVVAYNTALKRSVRGVDAGLLEEHGAVHPLVAEQMADRVRSALAVDGRPSDVGLSTTGVAGPDWQDGQPPGTVFLGIAVGSAVRSVRLDLSGDRGAIRRATVSESLTELSRSLLGSL
jgi:nicotinamide-nucleotide amidase